MLIEGIAVEGGGGGRGGSVGGVGGVEVLIMQAFYLALR